MSAKKKSRHTFDSIIVTSPDATAARVVAAGPLQILKDEGYNVISTCDPLGCRCGSGGGTLDALLKVENLLASKTLILHAGGDSSRCPTQMVLGKAWTSLPSCDRSQRNPTLLLLETVSRLCQGIPDGSVVVAASDTILQLPHTDDVVDWNQCSDSAVLGVAVPAPYATAKNHGVYVLSSTQEIASATVRPLQVLQKPSLETLRESCNDAGEGMAWIDTGIVIFPPKAVQALYDMSQGVLRSCTEEGLTKLWEVHPGSEPLEEFAPKHALKVDLYTHFLRAIYLTDFEQYQQEHPDLVAAVLKGIFEVFRPFDLQVVAVPGQFLHLGTTQELHRFLLENSSTPKGVLKMTPRLDTWCMLPQCSVGNVMINSVLVGGVGSSVGTETVLEHVHLEQSSHAIQIGRGCLVSGLRFQPEQTLVIPDGVCVQMVPLQSRHDEAEWVYMTLGVTDAVKSRTTLYNKPLQSFLQWTGWDSDVLWEPSQPHQTLWNCKLHPVIKTSSSEDGSTVSTSFTTMFQWLKAYSCRELVSSNVLTSLETFKSCQRLSLAEIRSRADAGPEIEYRRRLTAHSKHIRHSHYRQIRRSLLEQREHQECQLGFVVDTYLATHDTEEVTTVLKVLDEVIVDTLSRQDGWPACGRTLMVTSALFADLEEAASEVSSDSAKEKLTSVMTACKTLLRSFCSPNTELADKLVCFSKIQVIRDEALVSLSGNVFRYFSGVMEELAAAVTELCVSGSTYATPAHLRLTSPIVGAWVVSTAPARVDLSGGWSDTPPICYEYGGAVTNMAVLVDGKRPLSCRCRIVPCTPASEGVIYLRSELRDGATGSLRSKVELDIGRLTYLQDYRDPQGDCTLLKCALVCLGFTSYHEIVESVHGPNQQSFQQSVNRFCQSESDVRLEIIVSSLLPHGSGMGTSSILGGCVLAAVARCVGVKIEEDDSHTLVQRVLVLEQLLTSGGGYQDQVGGLIGGMKLVSSPALTTPVKLTIDPIDISAEFQEELSQRLLLVFAGKTRLAKNILQNVLRRWARRTPEVIKTVTDLVDGAHAARDAAKSGKLDVLAELINSYWDQKKFMAGEESGAEPPESRNLISELFRKDKIDAASFCGAGGGGFIVLFLKKGCGRPDISSILESDMSGIHFTLHDCAFSSHGLKTGVLHSGQGDDVDFFDLAWHMDTEGRSE